jgi:hypothetical protein
MLGARGATIGQTLEALGAGWACIGHHPEAMGKIGRQTTFGHHLEALGKIGRQTSIGHHVEALGQIGMRASIGHHLEALSSGKANRPARRHWTGIISNSFQFIYGILLPYSKAWATYRKCFQ